MQVPVGVSNFRKLIEYRSDDKQPYLYVDKSLLIREVINDGADVIVLTRPRRFGKTINLSMLQHFLSAEVDGKLTKALFEGLKIENHPQTIQEHQGQYPVISLSFKDVKRDNFSKCLEKVSSVLSKLYEKFETVLCSEKISHNKQRFVQKIIAQKGSETDLADALVNLTEYLNIYYDKPVVLLIDEYDAPILHAYSSGYYQEAISFFRNLFSAALKDNSYLAKGVLTGILRVAKENIFSGLNNVKVYSILHDKYASYFGFTEPEVDELLTKANLTVDRTAIKSWYNSYSFGDQLVYNPWSIINCVAESGQLIPYWINTSGNELIKTLMIEATPPIQAKLERLMAGQSIRELIDEHVIFDQLETNQTALWTLLLMSGYLKASNLTPEDQYLLCELHIPNQEVLAFYRSTITSWLSEKRGIVWYKQLLTQLTTGDIEAFAENLQLMIEDSFSFRDVDKKNGERFYHGLMLGLVVGLRDRYTIKSNRESGKGLFDTMLIPTDKTENGIVFEFKVADSEAQLEATAKQALQQISAKDYVKELQQQDVSNIIKIGIGFAGKQIKVVSDIR